MQEHPICTPNEPRPEPEPFARELLALLPRRRAFLGFAVVTVGRAGGN